MASHWIRVARGLQKVAGAVSQHLAEDVGLQADRALRHASDLAKVVIGNATTTMAGAARSSEHQFHSTPKTKGAEKWMSSFSKEDSPSAMEETTQRADKSTLQPGTTTAGKVESHLESSESMWPIHEDRTKAPSTAVVPLPVTHEPRFDPTENKRKRRGGGSIQMTLSPTMDHSSDDNANMEPSPNKETYSRQPSSVDITTSPSSSQKLKEQVPVPSTRWGRALGFANLGLGLAYGAVGEGARRLLDNKNNTDSVVLTDANADRLAATLCRMRGAALKLGQMLSIQDATLLPPPLTRALAQVRQGAASMPAAQLEQQLVDQYGGRYQRRFVHLDWKPFAAASIGQVHRAVVRQQGRERDVVVKVQYPGVARSIESDLRNLGMIVKWSGLTPKGLFIENIIRVGEQELSVECDYRREKDNQLRMQALVEGDAVLQEHRFRVPDVLEDWCTDEVFVSEYFPGGTIDQIAQVASQEERNRIGRMILYLTMQELFTWRFMQTDPNWGNFLYDSHSQTTGLIDFGAAREFSKEFVDGYLRIVWASANQDVDTLLQQSRTMKFLTGDENPQMIRAHTMSGFTVGEPFASDEPFDFQASRISERMGEHTSVFLRHRLTPPPEEVYTLHRKLAGAYMLCIKLGSVVSARELLVDIVSNHEFEDGLPHPIDGR